MTMLSSHFSLAELTITQAREIDNTPSAQVQENLRDLAGRLEAVRELLDRPIIISSGYRSPKVNSLVGGSKTSAHIEGRAVDFICPGFGTPLEVCRAIVDSVLDFDQCIYEGTWVHLSFAPAMRRQVLTAQDGKYIAGLNSKNEVA